MPHVILRFRFVVLALATAVVTAPGLGGLGGDWPDFMRGGDLLFAPGAPDGGLHVFARHPELQTGPLSLLAAALVRAASPGTGYIAAQIVIAALGLACLVLIERAALRVSDAPASRIRTCLLLGGVVFVWQWHALAAAGHIDDALCLTAAAAAGLALAGRRSTVAAVAVGTAIAAKPWGLLFVPLLLAVPGRRRISALALAAAVPAVCWAPFLVGDAGTLDAGRFRIRIYPDSVLALFQDAGGPAPLWVRPAQLALGTAIGSLLVLRRQWPALFVTAIAIRMLLDAGTAGYYSSGLIMGALLFDLLVARSRIPLLTVAAFALLYDAPHFLAPGAPQAIARALVLVACIAAATASLLPPVRFGRHLAHAS